MKRDVEWLELCVEVQADRIKELERMVRNLGGNPHTKE